MEEQGRGERQGGGQRGESGSRGGGEREKGQEENPRVETHSLDAQYLLSEALGRRQADRSVEKHPV